MVFCQVQVWSSLIILSFSLSWSLRVFLEHSSLVQGKEKQAKEMKIKRGSRKGKQDQVALAGILVGNLLHVGFPSLFEHAWLCMSVYDSVVIGEMVFSSYESGF